MRFIFRCVDVQRLNAQNKRNFKKLFCLNKKLKSAFGTILITDKR